MKRILLAEDDNDMRQFLTRALKNAGYEVVSFDNGLSAYERLREEPFSLLLSDIVMPEMDGIELARRATELDPDLKRTILAEGIRSAAFIPLCVDNKLIGKFMAYFDTPHVFTADEIELSLTIARHLAFAIQRRRTEDAMRANERRFRAMIDALPAAIYTTDAEGRLVMADALVLAQRAGADAIVDIATLTGAMMRALGRDVAGVIGNHDGLVEAVRAAGTVTGEPAWPMPLWRPYAGQLDSTVADLKNLGWGDGGAITAALFLERFVGTVPWAHLDIAGTAWAEEAKPWQTKGATGVAVRTLAQLAFTSGDWK